jgi:hypothetical protein
MGEGYECYTLPLYPGEQPTSPGLQEAGWASGQILKGKGFELHPASSELLYFLRYPGRQNENVYSSVLHMLRH